MTTSRNITRRSIGAAVCLSALALVAAGCGAPESDTPNNGSASGAAVEYPTKSIDIMVPATAGGGFDGLGRAVQSTLKGANLVSKSIDVSNVPGAGGTVGLTELIDKNKGDAHRLMITGYTTVGAAVTNKTKYKLTDATPIATLTDEAAVLVVQPSSKYKTVKDVVEAWKADPKAVKFAGGSLGGPDHIAIALLAKAAGIDAKALKDAYVPYSGTPEQALTAGSADVVLSGISELESLIKNGKARPIAVTGTAAQDVAGTNVQSLKEAGYDVVVTNWRGIVAPPGISEGERAAIVSLIDKMYKSDAWKKVLEERKWNDAYRSGDEAKAFFTQQVQDGESILKDAGLA